MCELLGRPFDLGASRVLEGRSWVGDVELPGGRAAVAMAPVYSARGDRLLGLVAVQRSYPGVLGSLEAAAPNLLTYLGLASALGISSIPTLMVFRDDVLVYREAGALPASALNAGIEVFDIRDLARPRPACHGRAAWCARRDGGLPGLTG